MSGFLTKIGRLPTTTPATTLSAGGVKKPSALLNPFKIQIILDFCFLILYNIRITNKKERKMRIKYKNTYRLSIVQTFVNRALEHLELDAVPKATIIIKFVPQLDGGDTEGYCWTNGHKKVHIQLSQDRPFLKQLRALGHELIHAKQFLLGELDHDLKCWKGKDFSEAEYEDQPWEVEAHGLEDELFMVSFPWDVEVL